MTNDEAKDVLLKHFDAAEVRAPGSNPDGIIGKLDLQTIAKDPNADPKLKEAASRALNDQNLSGPMNIHGDKSKDIGFSKKSIEDSRKV